MKKIIHIIIVVVIIVGSLYSFGIFGNSQGAYRKYLTASLPVVLKAHWTTSQQRIDGILAATDTWKRVPGAYFEFGYGGTTFANTVNRDGTNLVYFDSTYQNFTQGSNVIAFSSTYTDGDGQNYHAVESDLVWNAGDFPPANDGSPNRQDLQAVLTHELGHHLGLGHLGPVGGPPGVGEQIPSATMYGTIASGDTTKRSLHIHDIMGIISIYPRWTFHGQIIDTAGNALQNAFYYLNGMESALILPPENVGNRWQYPGYVITDTVLVDNLQSEYKIIPRAGNPHLSVNAFGYAPYDSVFSLDSLDIENHINLDIVLQSAPRHNLTIQLVDSLTLQPVQGYVNYYAQKDLSGNITFQDASDVSGEINSNLPEEIYTIEIRPELPYSYHLISDFNLTADSITQIKLNKAQIILVDDDYDSSMTSPDHREDFYFNLLNGQGRSGKYAYLDMHVDLLTDSLKLNEIPSIVWVTGKNPDPEIKRNKEILKSYLLNGNNLFLCGNYLFSAIDDSAFMHDWLQADFAGSSTTQLLRGTTGDPIGNNQFLSLNYTNADMINPVSGPYVNGIFTFLGKTVNGMIRYNYKYKLVFSSFDLSNMFLGSNFLTPDVVFERVINWLENTVTDVQVEDVEQVPVSMRLYQNYPNPFNPVTKIRFDVNKKQHVSLIVYNLLGQKVRTLVDNKFDAGKYDKSWNGLNDAGAAVASGVYYYRIKSDEFAAVRKMFFIK